MREKTFFLRAYLHTWVQLVKAPKLFFDAGDTHSQGMPAAAFLAISSLISAGAAILTGPLSGNLVQGAILAVNGFGMALLAAGLAYPMAVPLTGHKIDFSRIFSIFAHSSGVTLLLSWNPVLVMIAEPWKWWLIWTGMRRGCGLTRGQTAVVLALTVTMIIMLFRILLPLTAGGPEG
ncbi:MAG: hypothetical protein C4519_25470 [Desulfobacteraceae bacterium]|nr:MAG: hypothetical protein C4519_25470 [Desulfobacteraceae bacterium]